MFEVRVLSSGINVALGKSSSQSSTFNNFGPSLAVDGKNNTFSHTNIATSGNPVWWNVDLGNEFAIESVTVLNRWCGSSADPNGCLCRLSSATLFLIDSNGDIVATQSVGTTCGQREVLFDDFVEPTPSPTLSPSYSPTSSLNPTSSLVKDFSFVGQGWCRDSSYNYYSFYYGRFSVRHTYTYCLDWCSQNALPDLVGVEVNYEFDSLGCACLFSGGLPPGLNYSDYSPPAENSEGFWDGDGPILTSWGYNDTLCYRYDVSICVVSCVCPLLYGGVRSSFFMLTILIYSFHLSRIT